MELAIPLIALGGMYVVSNQKNQSCATTSKNKKVHFNQESFKNMGKPGQNAYLPNTNIPPQNFPVSNIPELVDTVARYDNPNTATDKYFNQNLYEAKENKGYKVGNTPQEIYSMTGNYLDSKQFKHNNMVPFYGAKIKGYTYDASIAESVLDNMIGSGSQVIKKIEQAPLFKPEDNVQWAYGTPNNSDFYQSRVNPGMKNNNVKPFETEYVGPGLNQGFTTNGSGGFNSGMEARDTWLPKTVDQLRVATNPKLEYSLENLEGPSNAYVKNSGLIGRVEKHTPDTFFINSQDRWLTTTGAEKGETLRPIQEMGVIRRPGEANYYAGVAGPTDRVAGPMESAYEITKRTDTMTCDVPHSSARGCAPGEDGNKRIDSFTNYTNNRSTARQPDTLRSGFGGAIGAVIAPLMDILRPSRKEEVVSNLRIYGEAGSTVPSSYVLNPNDITPTTVKETTLFATQFNINNQKEGHYVNNNTPLQNTQRETTDCSYIGSAGGYATAYGDMDYESAYRQHNNDIKSQTIHNRPNQGGTQIFNQQMNVNISREDSTRFDNRMNPASSITPMPPSKENFGAIRSPQMYDQNMGCDRIQPDILDAFRKNPYTHSLTTSV